MGRAEATVADIVETTRAVATVGGPLGVAILEPAAGWTRTFLVAMGYGGSIEPFELQRFRLLAGELAARLVVVETPGCGLPGTGLTWGERWSLLAWSSFRPVARRMLDAAVGAAPDLLAEPSSGGGDGLGVIGYSLGTSTGTAMATEIRRRTGRPVTALVLVEPVAGRRWRSRDLIAATRAEDSLVDHALATNQDVPGAVEPWDRRQDGAEPPVRHEPDMTLLANALRAGRLPGQVAATGVGRVIIVRGRSSRLSLEVSCAQIAAAARASGARVDEFVMAGTHGLWHSLPSVARLARFVRETLEDAA